MKFNHAEYVLQSAELAFRQEFAAELRQRLLDIATAEIEQIVKEVSDKVSTTVRMDYNVQSHSHNLTVKVTT